MLSRALPSVTVFTHCVWYELHETMESAITREKTIKGWKRQGKLELIEKENPQ